MTRDNLDRSEVARRYTEPGMFPIDRITRIGQVSVPAHHRKRTFSRSGHLLHLMEEGEYQFRSHGRTFAAKAGDLLYYHDADEVLWLENPVPVRFLTIGFYAPTVSDLLPERQIRSTETIRHLFREIYAESLRPPTLSRDMRLYGDLCKLILALPHQPQPVAGDHAQPISHYNAKVNEVWWDLERWVKESRNWHASLSELSAAANASASTISRVCHRATGSSPVQRLRMLRLAEAQALVLYADLTLSEIAQQLGYGRVHELSRDFRRFYGYPPSSLRRAGKPPRPDGIVPADIGASETAFRPASDPES